jgi:hypothetical protein
MPQASTGGGAVWDVYDSLRTARFNELYWLSKLNVVRKRNRNLQLVVAIATPSSAVATFTLEQPIG